MIIPKLYSTSDLSLSSTLICKKHDLLSITKEGSKFYFNFDNSPELGFQINEFYSGKVLLDPQFFSQTMKSLKTRLYNHH